MAKGAASNKPKVGTRPVVEAQGATDPQRAADAQWESSIGAGASLAAEVLKQREAKLAKGFKSMVKPGTLVAEGDSWFDYPLSDVLESLEDNHGWDVVSVAHHGHTVEEIAYSTSQIAGLERALRKLSERHVTPKAVLLSGGGNDIAGGEFAMLLNHAASRLEPLNELVLQGAIDQRLRAAIVSFAAGVTTLCERLFGKKLPIVLHGYDFPVPDGRGFLGGFSILPGPWLQPGFRRKGYDDLARCTELMRVLMGRFNTLLASIAGGPGLEHLHYVSLLGALSSKLEGEEYKEWWANELHPTGKGFRAVARVLQAALEKL